MKFKFLCALCDDKFKFKINIFYDKKKQKNL